ncbi:MAG TPA: PAP2 family protein [Lactobacillus sp.]|nr:PAP2 family protein [Lactobacillus sp.]
MGLLEVQTSSRWRWTESISLLVIFTALAASVKLHLGWVTSLDQGVAGWLTGWENSSRTAGFIMVSKFGSPLVATILAVALILWLWWKRERIAAGISFLIYFCGNALALAVKYLVGRVRPMHELVADSGFSFPSGHVFSSTLLILLLLLILNHYLEFGGQFLATVAAVLWLGMLMIARVYLRNHYATDVLGSVLLASGWLMASQLICSVIIARVPRLANIQGDDE